MMTSEGGPPKIGHKDTTIFSNRCYFIEKLTPNHQKNLFDVGKRRKKVAKKSDFIVFS